MPQDISSLGRRFAREQPRRRVTAIDGLRVFAMIAVVLYHANPSWLPGGFLGVTVFFSISGYLITDGLLREVRRSQSVDIARFYRRRLARLVPQMVLVVAATALLCAILAPQLLAKMRGDAIPALLFVENWWYIIREQSYFAASGLPSPITHFWFLSVLMQFYLLWPIVMAGLSRVFPSPTTQRRVVGALALASAILAAILYNPRADPSRVYYGTDTRLAEILVGAWAAYAFPTDGVTRFAKSLVERIPALRSAVVTDILGVAALAGLVALMLNVNGYSPLLYRGGLLLVSILTALLVAVIARPESLLAVPLGCKPLVVLSARTFGIYLWHYPLFLVMNPATRTTDIAWWVWLLEFVALAVVVELSYRFIEQPFAQLIDDRGEGPMRHGNGGTQSAIPYMGVLGAACAVSALLLVVGPFWYVDGASQQASSDATNMVQKDLVVLVGDRVNTAIAEQKKRAEEEANKAKSRLYEVDPTTGRTDAPVILIGDSVPAGAIDQFNDIFPNGLIDAEVGRQLYSALEVYEGYRDSGYDQSVVVFASGDNGVAQEEDVEAMVQAAGPNRQVYFVTVRVPLELQDMNNELFYEVASRHDNVDVIDWYAESEGHDEYFWDDGTHLRPEGAEAYVLMLRRAICGV